MKPFSSIIKFSYNWNGKLNCDSFTTLRLHNPLKYCAGHIYDVWLVQGKENKEIGQFVAVEIRQLKLSALNNFIAYLDTGYSVEKAKEIIQRMYPKHDDPYLDFILLKKVKPTTSSTT